MATRKRAASGRNVSRAQSRYYVYGNVAAQPAYVPRREEEKRVRRSRKPARKRKPALHIGGNYVVFLTVCAVITLIACVSFVHLQSQVTEQSAKITSLQTDLANLREENTARTDAIMDGVNLEQIREKAQTKLGMVYASADQIVTYENPSKGFTEQHEGIPKDGVIASDDR